MSDKLSEEELEHAEQWLRSAAQHFEHEARTPATRWVGEQHQERRQAINSALRLITQARRSIPSEEGVEGSRDEDIRECQAFSAGYEAAQELQSPSVDPTSLGSHGAVS